MPNLISLIQLRGWLLVCAFLCYSPDSFKVLILILVLVAVAMNYGYRKGRESILSYVNRQPNRKVKPTGQQDLMKSNTHKL